MNSKFEKSKSSSELKSGLNEEDRTLKNSDIEITDSRILELEEKVEKLKKQIKDFESKEFFPKYSLLV